MLSQQGANGHARIPSTSRASINASGGLTNLDDAETIMLFGVAGAEINDYNQYSTFVRTVKITNER